MKKSIGKKISKTCQNCKWWYVDFMTSDIIEKNNVAKVIFAICKLPTVDKLRFAYEINDDIASYFFDVIVGGWKTPKLKTGCNFGCINFEKTKSCINHKIGE